MFLCFQFLPQDHGNSLPKTSRNASSQQPLELQLLQQPVQQQLLQQHVQNEGQHTVNKGIQKEIVLPQRFPVKRFPTSPPSISLFEEAPKVCFNNSSIHVYHFLQHA